MLQISVRSDIYLGSYYDGKPMIALGSTLQFLWW